MEHEFLTGKEHDAYISDISEVVNNLIDKIIGVADKHNVDRDNAMQHFSQLFGAMVEISTFQHWEGGA